ncbi:MAG: hypothetical protein NVS9B13_07980 [Candidatus Acidiferrum sp.]
MFVRENYIFVGTLSLCVLLSSPWGASAQGTAAHPPVLPSTASTAEFISAADQVLKQMSEITELAQMRPVKKTLRSREEIRAYVVRQMDEEKNPAERYAEKRSAEAFGLIPKNFDLDSFMVDLLTEQIAGLYDPKAGEFYIADWIPLEDQRMVMAHELTHALQDQHFSIAEWVKAARPDDDAEFAREAVLEGSAMAAMLEYELREKGLTLNDLPDIAPSILVGDLSSTPGLKKAPPFLKDALLFPYFGGLTFSNALLKAGGWSAVSRVFTKPPASTQQILHPAIYNSGKIPASVTIPSAKLMGEGWTKLEDNVMGEFGWKEVLKQFLDEARATPLAAGWDGDRYVLFERKQDKKLILITMLKLASAGHAARFFGQYSEALEKKHEQRSNLFRRPSFFSFDTPEGGVFLRCAVAECVTLEGGDRSLFLKLNNELGWGAVPEQPKEIHVPGVNVTHSGMPAAVFALR